MSEPFLAEIRIMGFNFAPRGWASCDGQILPINQNQALYSLLGTTYGGDGRTSFGLPDLRGRIPFHAGSTISLGQKTGEESHTLLPNEIPAHTHLFHASSVPGDSESGIGNLVAPSPIGDLQFAASESNAKMAATSGGTAMAHENMPPYLALNFCIAIQGLFPPRN